MLQRTIRGFGDHIQIFDPRRTGGANAARFVNFINNMLHKPLISVMQKVFFNPIQPVHSAEPVLGGDRRDCDRRSLLLGGLPTRVPP